MRFRNTEGRQIKFKLNSRQKVDYFEGEKKVLEDLSSLENRGGTLRIKGTAVEVNDSFAPASFVCPEV